MRPAIMGSRRMESIVDAPNPGRYIATPRRYDYRTHIPREAAMELLLIGQLAHTVDTLRAAM